MIRPGTLARGMMVALLAVSLAGGTAAAQQRGMGPGPGNRQQLERRVRARFAEMMQQRLGLSTEQSKRLNDTVESFMERRQRLVADEQALRRRMEAIALEQEPTDAEARTLLTRMQELRDQEAGLFQDEQQALMQVLTPVQLVRFHAMREQLGQRIQQLRGGGGQGPMPGGPRGGRGGPPPGGAWPDTTWGSSADPWPGEPPGA
jgi:Spy/CpxP family protein refolding chaperone